MCVLNVYIYFTYIVKNENKWNLINFPLYTVVIICWHNNVCKNELGLIQVQQKHPVFFLFFK